MYVIYKIIFTKSPFSVEPIQFYRDFLSCCYEQIKFFLELKLYCLEPSSDRMSFLIQRLSVVLFHNQRKVTQEKLQLEFL